MNGTAVRQMKGKTDGLFGRLPMRTNKISGRGAAGPRQRVLLPYVPEGLRRAVHGFRSISRAPGEVVHAARHFCEFEPGRTGILPQLRHTSVLSSVRWAECQPDYQQPG